MEIIVNKMYVDKYKEFVGIDPTEKNKYDEKAFLEIMARSLAFWWLEKTNPSIDTISLSKTFNKDEIQSCFDIDKKYDEIVGDIATKFNENQRKIIYDRFKILKNSERNNKISQIRKKLQILSKLSKQLYDDCIKDEEISEEEKKQLLNPTKWLSNQQNMREYYEHYIQYTKEISEIKIEEIGNVLDDITVKELVNNKFVKYMKFMYDNYPVGYGETIKAKHKNKEFYDGAEIYYEMV